MPVHRLLILVPWLLALASTGRAQVARRATRFDSLVTAAQVQQFVRTQNQPQFVLTDSLRPECRYTQVCAALTGSSWLKEDFDGNGRTDLVVVGYRNATSFQRRVLCFLDLGYQEVKTIWLSDNGYECAVPQLGMVQGKPAIYYAHVQIMGERFAQNRQAVCRVDTLVFDYTRLVEYNHAPKDNHIQKVTFNTSACYGTCPILTLQIAHNGMASYQAEAYNPTQGNFTAVVEAKPLAELWALLNYLNFPTLQDHYAIGATDHPTATLTITYAGGKVKTIEDYGEQGTFGLQQVYKLLFALRTTQAWKRSSLNER